MDDGVLDDCGRVELVDADEDTEEDEGDGWLTTDSRTIPCHAWVRNRSKKKKKTSRSIRNSRLFQLAF